jgi:hypothetical protein
MVPPFDPPVQDAEHIIFSSRPGLPGTLIILHRRVTVHGVFYIAKTIGQGEEDSGCEEQKNGE